MEQNKLTARLFTTSLVCLFLLVSGGPANGYNVTIPPGIWYVGDPLLSGPTSLGSLFPNQAGQLDGNQVLIWNCSQVGYTCYTFDSTSASGFSDCSATAPVPAPIINPGEGFVFENQSGVSYNWTITGAPTAVPPSLSYCGCGKLSLLCAMNTNILGTFQNITGYPPSEGAQEMIWSGNSFTTFTFTGGGWSPPNPRNLAVGESAFFLVPCATNCVKPPPGMSAWWPFDEASGPPAEDIAGTVNNRGIYMGNPTAIVGMVSNALCFNGTSDYVLVTNHAEINFIGSCSNGAQSFSIDAWIRAGANGAFTETLLDKRVTPAAPQGYVVFLYGGKLGFQFATGSGGYQNYVGSTPDLRDAQWHFIAITVARCATNNLNVISFYLDGSLKSTSFDPNQGDMNNNADLQIGRENPAFSPNYYLGCLDELEFFKRVLTPQEIQGIYSAGAAGKCKSDCFCPNTLTNSLPRADDDGSARVDLMANGGFNTGICFGGNSYSAIWINNNGNITFNDALGTYTPSSLASLQIPIIAPFWADVDTRPANGGTVTHGGVTCWVPDIGGVPNVGGSRNAYEIKWSNVGYFNMKTDKTNTFQLTLIDRSDRWPGDFDFEFYYCDINWETGDVSGGHNGLGGSSARAGYANALENFELSGSGVSGAFLDSQPATGLIYHSLNSLTPGAYYFKVMHCGVTNNSPSETNSPPVAEAGTNQLVCVTTNCCAWVQLDGSRSYDVDAGDTLTYSWDAGVNGPTPWVLLCDLGPHVITLTVNDGHGHTSADTVTIILSNCVPPVITSYPTNVMVTNCCDAAIPDLRGGVVASDRCPITVTQTPLPGTPVAPGSYPILLKVCDGAGNCSSCVAWFTVLKTPSASRVWNTGVSATGAPLPAGTFDPHFTLVSSPPSGGTTAVAVGSHTSWNAPGVASSWIGTSINWSDVPGNYIFQTWFTNNCPSNNCGSNMQMMVEGRWAADDAVILKIDGVQRASRAAPPNYVGWQDFSVSGLSAGPHLAQFIVTNICCPMGLRVEWTNYCCPSNIANCLPPYILNQPQDQTIGPYGSLLQFSVLAGGTPPLSYQWFRNGVAVPGATAAMLSISENSDATYQVVITNACGQVPSRSARVWIMNIGTVPGGNITNAYPTLNFSTQTGLLYNIYYRPNLNATSTWKWLNMVPGTPTNIIWWDPKPDPVMRLYKVVPTAP